jgi:hypothetical protein
MFPRDRNDVMVRSTNFENMTVMKKKKRRQIFKCMIVVERKNK